MTVRIMCAGNATKGNARSIDPKRVPVVVGRPNNGSLAWTNAARFIYICELSAILKPQPDRIWPGWTNIYRVLLQQTPIHSIPHLHSWLNELRSIMNVRRLSCIRHTKTIYSFETSTNSRYYLSKMWSIEWESAHFIRRFTFYLQRLCVGFSVDGNISIVIGFIVMSNWWIFWNLFC